MTAVHATFVRQIPAGVPVTYPIPPVGLPASVSCPLPAGVRVQAQVAAEQLADARAKAERGAYAYAYGKASTALEQLLAEIGAPS